MDTPTPSDMFFSGNITHFQRWVCWHGWDGACHSFRRFSLCWTVSRPTVSHSTYLLTSCDLLTCFSSSTVYSSNAERPGMATEPSIPSFNYIRSQTLQTFGKPPCAWQVHICEQVLHGDRDIISIAGTGMGKTLTFWMPLLFRPRGIQIVVTPLNILGEQNTAILAKLNVEAIFISAKTATEQNFQVC